jgi:hypothetical protein
MPSPFPGMDPYIEASDVWPDFHHTLATAIRAELNLFLQPPYYARVETRSELGIIVDDGVIKRIIPDVFVVRHPKPRPSGVMTVVERRIVTQEPVQVTINTETWQHAFIEIRDAKRGHQIVTVIELVSPSNKGSGPDREAYERKQQEVLHSTANLVEIDLLRVGARLLPYQELAAVVSFLTPDYLVLVNRTDRRSGVVTGYDLFPIALTDVLPSIPIPLLKGEADIPLDLQIVVNRVYDEGQYHRFLDYSQPPEPPLTEPQAAWADEVLREAGLRE